MIALVDKSSAVLDKSFLYLGEGDECANCSRRLACHSNLVKGHLYRVTEVKPKVHPCPIFGEVRVCVVEEDMIKVAISSSGAYPEAKITYHKMKCDDILCPEASICIPEGIEDGEKVLVEKVLGRLECPQGKILTMLTLKRV